jgi:hypothetical protein
VRQFLHAQPDGPVPFHFPARPIAEELELAPPTGRPRTVPAI